MNNENLDNILESIDLSSQPPLEEPARQYYFLKKCRVFVSEEEKRLGRKLTACVTTFGCQMNARDSEKLSGILEQAGYQLTVRYGAELVTMCATDFRITVHCAF